MVHMCGIVGYAGGREAKALLFDGLRRLEYRGYDSAGLCVVSPSRRMGCIRATGNLDELEAILPGVDLPGTLGIGHTRWATHGAPTRENAHPHHDCTGDIAIVHNGIIENFAALRRRLQEEGHRFNSETDSEIIAHLIEANYLGNLGEALRRAAEEVEGAYAIVAIHREHPGLMVATRKDSPLILGCAEEGCYLASAAPAFLSETNRIVYLEEDEIIEVEGRTFTIRDPDGGEARRAAVEVDWDVEAAEKGGYEDFMLKEIYEQPDAVADTIRDKFDGSGEIEVDQTCMDPEKACELRRIIVVACGTSFHAGLLAKYLFERWAALPVEIEIASEFRYRNLVLTPDDLVVAVSQSGETADTMAGVREAKRRGAGVIAVVNVVGSMMTREADGVFYTHAGPEIGVAATKTYTAQMAAMYLLAMYLGRRRGQVSQEKYEMILDELRALPKKMLKVLASDSEILECAGKYASRDDFLFLGRSVGYPVAMEGALKLKEISYVHAEGYPAGEMKHGPIALLDERVPVVAVAPKNSVYDKMTSNIEEVKARQAPVIAIATEGDREITSICDDVLWVPETSEMLYPLLTVIPLQLLAYHVAKLRGCNVDQPRNLAKTVTVE